MQKPAKGFTLMELMVVIVIVGILASVAVPLYVNYVKDSQRTEAKGAINAVIAAEQNYYQLNGTYTPDTFVKNPGPKNQLLNCDLTDALGNWTITIPSADDKGYVVLATGNAGTPTAGRSVRLTYSRLGQPIWD